MINLNIGLRVKNPTAQAKHISGTSLMLLYYYQHTLHIHMPGTHILFFYSFFAGEWINSILLGLHSVVTQTLVGLSIARKFFYCGLEGNK